MNLGQLSERLRNREFKGRRQTRLLNSRRKTFDKLTHLGIFVVNVVVVVRTIAFLGAYHSFFRCVP
jgi:hypothetical protein